MAKFMFSSLLMVLISIHYRYLVDVITFGNHHIMIRTLRITLYSEGLNDQSSTLMICEPAPERLFFAEEADFDL